MAPRPITNNGLYRSALATLKSAKAAKARVLPQLGHGTLKIDMEGHRHANPDSSATFAPIIIKPITAAQSSGNRCCLYRSESSAVVFTFSRLHVPHYFGKRPGGKDNNVKNNGEDSQCDPHDGDDGAGAIGLRGLSNLRVADHAQDQTDK